MKTLKNKYRITTDGEYFYIQIKGWLLGWYTYDEEQICIDGLAWFEAKKFINKNDAKKYICKYFFGIKLRVVS